MIKGQTICVSGGKLDSKGRKINEDIVLKGTNYAILMDGATGLGNFQFADSQTNAEWYVQECSSFIKQRLEINDNVELSKIVFDCINYIKNRIEKMEEEANYKLASYEEPSSSLIILRENNGITDIFSLGDSITMIKLKNGERITLREENLCALDDKVINRMSEIAKEQGINVIDTIKYDEIQKFLRDNREKKNSGQDDGYWILGTSLEAITHAKQMKIESDKIDKIICLSDGFNYKMLALDEEQFLNLCDDDNILDYAQKTIAEEEKDNGCNKCPRFKVKDDLSGFVWHPVQKQYNFDSNLEQSEFETNGFSKTLKY